MSQLKGTSADVDETRDILFLAESAQQLSFHHPDSAFLVGMEGVNRARALGFRKGEALCRNAVGSALFTQSDYPGALEHFSAAYAIARELEDQELIAAGFLNFGNIKYYQHDIDHAERDFQRSLMIGEEIGDRTVIARASVNLGAIAVGRQQYDSGMGYLRKAAASFEASGDDKGLSYCYRNIAVAFQLQGDREKAMTYLHRSLALAEALKNMEIVSGCLQAIADIHRQNNEYVRSIEYGLRALATAQRINDLPYVKGAASTLAAVYETTGDFRKALYYSRIANAANDSVVNNERNRRLRTIQHRFELESKQKEIDLLEQRAGNQRLVTFVIFIGLVTLAVVSFVIYRSLKKEQASKERLVAINQEKQRLITDLTAAMENIRTLGELLPVCSNCKSVRDDQGYWQAVDRYITSHTDTRISHGICPECIQKLYPDVANRVLKHMAK